MTIIKKLVEVRNQSQRKRDYQFPGFFHQQYCREHFILQTTHNCYSTANPHYLWGDIQMCKSRWNKDPEVDVSISGKKK